jgi:hypothetical protein
LICCSKRKSSVTIATARGSHREVRRRTG